MEISGDDLASGDAFAELVGMAVEVQPSLADRATRDLSASQRASASVAGMHCSLPMSCMLTKIDPCATATCHSASILPVYRYAA